MNERIRELAMQTDRECEHLGQSDIGEDWVEKFAELIVQECIEFGIKNSYIEPEYDAENYKKEIKKQKL